MTVTDNKSATASDSTTVIVSGSNGLSQIENSLGFNIIVFPNPFISQTEIEFTLEKAAYVSLVVTDISGKKEETLVKGMQQEGKHKIIFEGLNLKSGIYFCQLIAGEKYQTIKMIINR